MTSVLEPCDTWKAAHRTRLCIQVNKGDGSLIATQKDSPTDAPRVLVVEDDRMIRLLLEEELSFQKFDARLVGEGAQALEIAREWSPDLVLLDVTLPRMTGLDVCRQLRADGLTAPILLLTARDGESDRQAGLEAGASAYITKPFVVAELMATIRSHIEQAARTSG